jgi:hypothetical protein
MHVFFLHDTPLNQINCNCLHTILDLKIANLKYIF